MMDEAVIFSVASGSAAKRCTVPLRMERCMFRGSLSLLYLFPAEVFDLDFTHPHGSAVL